MSIWHANANRINRFSYDILIMYLSLSLLLVFLNIFNKVIAFDIIKTIILWNTVD